MAKKAGLSHDALARDLAQHLAGYSTPMVVWTDMQLGPSGSARPDVYTIEKTYSALRARVFEVKVSRADFLSDVTSGKYLRYAQFAGSITFATPVGLVSKDEVPAGCGLITRSEEGAWRYQRKPTLQPTPELPRNTWLKLVIDGCSRHLQSEASACKPRQASEWLNQQRMRKLAGEDLGLALANRDAALHKLNDETDRARAALEDRLARERESLRAQQEEIESARRHAALALGLNPDVGWWQIRHELDERLGDAVVVRIDGSIKSVDRAIRNLTEHREDLTRLLPAPPEADAA